MKKTKLCRIQHIFLHEQGELRNFKKRILKELHLFAFTPRYWCKFLSYLTNTELVFITGFKIPGNPNYLCRHCL